MSTLFGRQQTPEEIKEAREARRTYQDYLSTTQTKTNTDVNKKAITPESGQAILKKIQEGQTWLEKHPNANFNELLTSQDSVSVEITRILKTDAPKRKLRNILLALPLVADEGLQKKILTAEQSEKLKSLATDEETWFKKQSATATEIQFSQEELKINETIQKLLINGNEVNYVRDSLQNAAGRDTSELEAYISTQSSVLQAAKSQQVNIQEGASKIGSVFVKVLTGLIVVGFCMMCGGFAANFAIGRPIAYRVFSFFYGAFPLFAPIVLLYTIYRRIRYGSLPYYSFLIPISLETSSGWIGEHIYDPLFHWIPDSNSIQAMKEYTEALSKAVVTA